MNGNVTLAVFGAGRSTATKSLYQYDYGQVLQITGLTLPDVYEVHFGNDSEGGTTKTSLGGPDGVVIPDEYLTSGADIWAFVYLHTGEDDGETEYVVHIPVRKRPEPSDVEPTPEQQDVITQTIAALNVAVDKAEDAVEHYPYIGVDGFWYVWDAEAEAFEKSVKATGTPGVGISSVAKTSTSGLIDTYTITYTDGATSTFAVTNGKDGKNIAQIIKGSTVGLVDTYYIVYTGGGGMSAFTVTNGKNGTDGDTPVRGVDYWTAADQAAIVADVEADVAPKVGTLSLSTSWTSAGSDVYTQAVTISGVTADDAIDLYPDATIISQMVSDGVSALYIDNNDGVLTAVCVGAALTASVSVQYRVTKVAAV